VRQTSLQLPHDLGEALEREAARWGRAKMSLIRRAIRRYVGYCQGDPRSSDDAEPCDLKWAAGLSIGPDTRGGNDPSGKRQGDQIAGELATCLTSPGMGRDPPAPGTGATAIS
jgi:hypothetical protein